MLLSEVIKAVSAEKLWDFEDMDCEIAGATDMFSELLAIGKEGMILITGLCNPQLINTADIVGVGAIIIARGKKVPEETVKEAKELGIPIAVCDLTMYSACGKLFVSGLGDVNGVKI